MGFLTRFEPAAKAPLEIPTGCFTMDAEGSILASTLPRDFPTKAMQAIGDAVRKTLRAAEAVGLGLSELTVHYGTLRISARDLHGGTLIFVRPLTPAITR